MTQARTIVALSSGSPPSGVAIIRMSGPKAFDALKALSGILPEPRRLVLAGLTDPESGEIIDKGLVAAFPGPRSFTGEDCVELQVHGSPAGVKALLAALTRIEGIALAGAGEFTRRAFENGKLELTAIEGLGDMLAAETEGQRRQALRRLEGGLARTVAHWRELLLDARADIEAHLDFSDEDDVSEALPQRFFETLAGLRSALAGHLARYEHGRVVREGFRVVLAGAPNAGKSSLLNALSGSELAIVTAEAGTTRDTRDVAIDLGGQLVIVTDTAGLRRTRSLAEAEGIRRAKTAVEAADLVLWLQAPDAPEGLKPETDAALWTVATKSDLGGVPGADLSVSVRNGEGVAALVSALGAHIEERYGGGEPELVGHLRDRAGLTAALDHLDRAANLVDNPELCAEELRLVSDALARLVGLMDSEAVLDRLFSGFCIGK